MSEIYTDDDGTVWRNTSGDVFETTNDLGGTIRALRSDFVDDDADVR